ADLMRLKSRNHSARSVELARIAVLVDRLLAFRVAARARLEILIDPGAVEKFHQRPVEHVDPDYRILFLVAVIVPGAVWGQNDIATLGVAALPFDVRVAASFRKNRAAGVGAMDVSGRDVAVIIDRDRATD